MRRHPMAGSFCARCGAGLTPGSPSCVICGAPAPIPVTPVIYAAGLAVNSPDVIAKGRRIAASSLTLAAAILLTISIFATWWEVTVSAGGSSASVSFLPGSSYLGSGVYDKVTFSGSATYSSAMLSTVGVLYEVIFWVGLAAAVASFVGMALGYASAYGSARTRQPVGAADVLAFVSFAVALILPILIALLQPWAYNSDSSNSGISCGTGASPCNSFWGSVSSGGETGTSGAGVGWYLAILAAILLLVALVLFWKSEPKLYTLDQITAVSPQAAAVLGIQAGMSSPPFVQADAPPTTVTPVPSSASRFCPYCGFSNSREYTYCQKCGKALPPPP
jgi:hypothetical protein